MKSICSSVTFSWKVSLMLLTKIRRGFRQRSGWPRASGWKRISPVQRGSLRSSPAPSRPWNSATPSYFVVCGLKASRADSRSA